MKKILVIVLVMFPFICSADFENFKWQFFKDVETSGNGLVRFVIDDEIFANTEKDLRDLRIISNDGEEIPYQLAESRAKNLVSEFQPEMLNNSYKPEEGSTAILDFGENNQGINRLIINTSAINFRRNVSIYGSDERNGIWSLVDEGEYIYDYTDKRGNLKSQSTEVNFPQSIFRYLKIVVADDENSPLKIDAVTGFREEVVPEKELERTPKMTIEQGKNAVENFTSVFLDLGQNGIATKKISLAITDENFNRGVIVFSSKNQRDWSSIGQSYIFRYLTPKFKGENLQLNFQETGDRYLKIQINNGDDKSLMINKATTFSTFKEVVFSCVALKSYKVFFGNPHARFPEYDFGKYFDFLETEKAPVLVLSSKKINDSYLTPDKWGQQKPVVEKKYKSDGVPFLMTGGLILVLILLLLMVYRFFRK